MPITLTMIDLLAKFTTTEDSTSERFSSTGAYIHVGTSTGAFASSQNSLLSTAAAVKAMSAGYPKRNDGTDSTGNNILAYRALFATNEANFAWNEWMVKNTTATATGTGTAFNRMLEDPSLGTKTSSQSWQLTVLLTLATST